jgi:hypothetical protein
LLTRALAGSSLAYQTVVTFATTSSLDLVGLFLTKVIDILTRPGNNTLQPVTQIIKIVKAVAESPDVRLITATQKTAMSLVFGKFFPLIHKILEQLGFHVNDGIVETPDDALQKLIPLLEAYCKCLQAFVQTFNAVRDPRAVGAVRGTPHAPFLLPEVWEMSDRRKAFDYLVSLIRSSVADSIGASAALKSVIQSVVLFDSNFQVTTGLYKLFCDMEAREEKVLKFLLLRHLDNLFLEFVSMSILRTAAEGHYFLRALAGQFCGENNEVDLTDLTPEDHQISNFLIGHIGSILILCFLLLSSPHKESRRVAFELLQRVSPIAAAYNDPFNVVPSARVNDYLKTHRNSLCALAFPPSPEELFELSTVFAKHMPFLTHRVFFEFLELFLNTDNFLQQNANLITALLNAVAPFARNTTFVGPIALPNDFDTPSSFTPFTLIRNLISRFSLLGKTSQLAWSRIFAEICHIEVNVVPLVQILVISGAEQANVDAVQTVCLYLVQSQAASVLQLLTQPLVFGSWFNTNVVEQSPHDWLKLSLRVLREVSQSNFTFLFPYLHVIFHFCLLFLNDDSHPNAVDVRILFDSVMSALLPQFRFPVKVRISFTTAEASTAIPIATLVSEIRERLEQVVPSAIHRWSQDALQWAVCCGNLTIASESALIYASVLNSPNYSDALPLIRAVDAVLKANDRNHRTEIFSYTRAALTALTSIVDVAVTQKTASLLLYVFDFAANFVNIVSVDLETARAAIRVLTVFITSQNLTEVERIAPRLLGIAKMLPNSFNDGSVLQFLTALIVHLPPATSQTLKVISLALLLPVFFAVVSAYHSVDPYSTFIEDNLVIQVFTAASEIGGAEFAGDSRYSEILINYFGNDETIRAQDPPDFLIKELAQEMWNSDSSELSLLGRFYAEMVKMDSNTVNSAIFTVVKIFILAVNDKPAICRIFADVICLAVRQIDRVAVELLGTFGKYAPPDIFTGPISTAPESTQIEEEVISVISRAVNEEIFGSRLPLLGQDSIVLQNRGCIIPMIPQFLPKSNELFVKVQFQPFFKQKEFWIALQSTLSNNLALQFKNPSAFDIYAHSQASSKTPEEQKVITSEIGCDAQLFILKDDELADFEKRLN